MIWKNLSLSLLLVFCLASCLSSKQSVSITGKIVEASCGQCNFGLPGSGCDLAIRIDGQAYYVEGSNIDDHGDAHADDGFCETIRKAKVDGKVVNNRFEAVYFELIPIEEEEN